MGNHGWYPLVIQQFAIENHHLSEIWDLPYDLPVLKNMFHYTISSFQGIWVKKVVDPMIQEVDGCGYLEVWVKMMIRNRIWVRNGENLRL